MNASDQTFFPASFAMMCQNPSPWSPWNVNRALYATYVSGRFTQSSSVKAV